jgi:membrane-associated phospholipid phosphatase
MNVQKNLLILIIISFQAQAQPDGTRRIQSVKFYVSKLSPTVPLLLAGLGSLATTDNDLIDKQDFYEARNKLIPRFRTHADDYLQYAPIAGVIVLNAVGIKGKHDRINQAALLIKSELIMTAIVFPFKQLTAVPRPDDRMRTSFPSGHTAQAFVAATFLHKEYGKKYPLLSVLGYSTAAGIGLLRMMNNRHWISDVLVGAGVGIFSTNLAYLTHQNKWGKKHKLFSRTTIVPSYALGSFGISMIIPVQ